MRIKALLCARLVEEKVSGVIGRVDVWLIVAVEGYRRAGTKICTKRLTGLGV